MNKAVGIFLLIVVLLSACSAPVDDPPVEPPAPTATIAPTDVPTPTPTGVPPVVLTICTTRLPETAFPYAGQASAAKARVSSWLYPPAFALDDGQLTPLILDKVPAESDGDLRLEPVPIRRGQTVVDARGELVTAMEGAWVRPSGCRDADCAITWNGIEPLEMDQMVIDFRLRADLTWTDGTPVTAADSTFSYRLASAPDSPAYGWAETRTQGYSALDARTVSWIGYPGFAGSELARFFWEPLPVHAFDPAAGYEAVAADGIWTAAPISYGPFALAEWGVGELRLARNPGYVLDTLPGVDQVVLRVVEGGAEAGWDALQDGACDALDASFRLEGEPALLAAIEADGSYDLRVESGLSWTQLVFGIKPAEYDALANPVFAQRPDYFANPITRQGMAYCLDRAAMLTVSHGEIWPSFLPPGQSQLGDRITYDPAAGVALLEAAGWRDHDGDPSTPRLAQDVLTVFNGVPLSLTLLVGPSPFHQDLAAVIRESLAACGVDVAVETLSTAELYAPGPDGPLFGRNFDLALIAWQPLPGPDCGLYTSWAVPNAGDGWIGTNIAGLADLMYDAACTGAALALPGEAEALLGWAEAVFVDLMPSVPLVAPPVIEVWRADS